MQKIIKLFTLMLGISSVPCIANNTVNRVYVSHEIAINHLHERISFWETVKQSLAFLGYGEIQLKCISLFILICACLPFEEMDSEDRFQLNSIATFLHAPKILLEISDYFIDRKIGLLRQQIDRLVEESVGGIEVCVVH